jgi:pimeloyl-ACP methyl ester carboxylesterase
VKDDSCNQTIQLADGRTLGYAEYGIPTGKPIFFFHGWPSSRLGLGAFHGDEVAERLGLRIIAPDRPGIGLSTFKPGRRFTDWPQDVVELADRLQLPRFGVLSWSAGSPYAAACAWKIPERLTAAGIVSGLARPWNSPGATQGLETKLLWNLARLSTTLLQLALGFMLRQMQKAAPTQMAETPKQAMMTAPDFAFYRQTPEWNQLNMAASIEGCRLGTGGTAYEGSLYWKGWGFRLEDIHMPVYAWHGDTDGSAPYPAQGQYLAKAIPDCRAKLYPGEGHMTVFYRYIEEIFGTLVAAIS